MGSYDDDRCDMCRNPFGPTSHAIPHDDLTICGTCNAIPLDITCGACGTRSRAESRCVAFMVDAHHVCPDDLEEGIECGIIDDCGECQEYLTNHPLNISDYT